MEVITNGEELEPVGYNKRIIAAVTRLQDKMVIDDQGSWARSRISGTYWSMYETGDDGRTGTRTRRLRRRRRILCGRTGGCTR